MTRLALPVAFFTTTLALSLPTQAAGLTRTFVSAAGSDSNPCTISQPCATFAHAYSLTAASGIIAALDPGKYGPLTITGPITINGNGWAAITAPAAGTGISINAGPTDNVQLTGLNIDGAAAGYNGIELTVAGSLTVTNCILQNFLENGGIQTTGNGIIVAPTSGTLDFSITDTTASNNGHAGIYYAPPSGSPSANGVIDHVVTNANEFGVLIFTVNASGGSIAATVSNSIASNNGLSGVVGNAGPGAITLAIDNVIAGGNGTGVVGAGTANILLGRSVVTGNSIGVDNTTSPNKLYTYRDNRINLNGTDISGALNTTFTTQ